MKLRRENVMSANEIRLRIKEAVSRIAGIAVDRIADDARFIEDLGLDSLSIIESLVVVEHEFRLQPEQEDLEVKVRSVEDAVQLVQTQLMRKAG
jgi:acyl carrier protein